MEFCAGFFKFFFQFSNALLISTKYLTIYFVRFLIYHNHEHQSRTHILVRDFDDSCANSLLAAILYQLLQIISGNHFVFPPQFLNSTSRCAFDDPDIPLILAHRQAALAFCRNPGIGHIQFPLRRYSGKRHRCRFPCSLLFSCIPTGCNIPLFRACRFIRNRHQQLSTRQHRLQKLIGKVFYASVAAMFCDFSLAPCLRTELENFILGGSLGGSLGGNLGDTT